MSQGTKDAQLLTDLETIAVNLGIDVRYEKGDFEGGLCRLEQNRIIIINKTLSDKHKIRLLARELSTLDLESVYIVPALREIVDQHLEPSTNEIITDK